MMIAIDGPAGAGKSTVAQKVAAQLDYVYIDTGSMYRALAFAVLQAKVPIEDEKAVEELLSNGKIELRRFDNKQRVYWNGTDITEKIRTPEVSNFASIVASYAEVRLEMLTRQRELAERGNVVMDGRDIGTHVLPHAEVKIFLTATIRERAQRRLAELQAKGHETSLEQLEAEIAERDKRDTEREVAPLRQAHDAILIDSTGQSIDEVVQQILEICKQMGDVNK